MSLFSNPYSNQIMPLTFTHQSCLLQRVSSTKEVEDIPISALNSELVCLNKDDDSVLYIKRVDSNGKATVKRYRYYEDPEPTQQEINDQRYVTMDSFNKFKEDILAALNKKQYSNEKGKYVNGSRSNNSDKENV